MGQTSMIQSHPLVAAIDAAHEAASDAPRPHLGASIIGHPCERYVWLAFRRAVAESFPGRILRLFRRGRLEERTALEDLRAAGISISATNPATRRQWAFADGHFGGSCDGVVNSNGPRPKPKAVLEIKTHNAKSFADLERHGVQKSKPQHWAQMQVYMHKMELQEALYYAVCKDSDALHIETVPLDAAAASALCDKAQRLATADRMPPPVSTDPSWYQCKMCSASDLCHGSKLTKQVHCRTCAHSTAERDGRWTCAKFDAAIPDMAAQMAGCDHHIIHPDLTPPDWRFDAADGGVIWITPAGNIHNAAAAYRSTEIVANPAACANGDSYIAHLRRDLGARVVG